MPEWLANLLPIVVLLAIVGVVVARLPRVELGHSPAFLQRRFLNWLPLGLTYAFLYMGRYNLTVATNYFGDRMDNAAFGTIFAVGTLTYGVSFVINGPLADKIGGRITILLAAAGSAVMNAAMGGLILLDYRGNLVVLFSILYAINMYFQAFGAVSVVKVNSAWFHVRERGVLGGVFGVLISLGVYFAFDWSRLIARLTVDPKAPMPHWVFFIPAGMLAAWFVIDYFLVFDRPSEAGHKDFDLGDATSGDTGPALSVVQVAYKMVTNRVIVIIAVIEFCSGFLRNALMHWYTKFATQTGTLDAAGKVVGNVVYDNWGLLLCLAGIFGGMFAGVISDKVFGSRRGPVAAVLYGGMVLGSGAMIFLLGTGPFVVGIVAVLMSLCIIGVHGMLSGTASADFGGSKNAGVAVGIIDGMVYLGTALESFIYAGLLPHGFKAPPGMPADEAARLAKEAAEHAANPAQWIAWPVAMVPAAILGFVLALTIWSATPKGKGGH